LSESRRVVRNPSDNKISINGVISQSYTFFTNNLGQFVKLAMIPTLLWICSELVNEYLSVEYSIFYNNTYIRAIISASFALIWYRQFLMGTEQATYRKLFKHVISSRSFSLDSFIKTILRVTLLTIVLVVPGLLLSISIMIYTVSQGVILDDVLIQEIALNSTAAIFLLLSPILIRLSLYSVGIALGRRNVSFREVWIKTKGYTWVLWLLTLRAFLPISLYSYCLTIGFGEMADNFELNYLLKSLFINIPAGIFTFILLAVVVAANGEAFKVIFGIRLKSRDTEIIEA
jgi:hypothetical protein